MTRINTGGTIRPLTVADLVVNPHGQRELRSGWAAQIAVNFQPHRLGYPVVSHRDDRYFIVDGQHRIEALRQLGRNNDQVQCLVYEGLTEAEEADLFLGHNDSKVVAAFDKFVVAVTAGRKTESDISAIVAGCGLRIGRPEGCLSCVATLKRVHGYGTDTLERTLTIANKSFGDAGLTADLIDGLGMFLRRFGGDVNDDDIIHRLTTLPGGLGAISTKASIAKVTFGKPTPQCIAHVLTDIVNKGRRTNHKLPSWWS